jgi:alkylated DNA repair protein (DNA oxidative demethylase)
MNAMAVAKPLDVLSGVRLWPERLNHAAQVSLIAAILERAMDAPFYRPQMPQSGKPFSVEETNLGSLGWVSDINGYRYERTHPVTQNAWPSIPDVLLELWAEHAGYPAEPECCLVNLYRDGAKMGLHQDRDEAAVDAPVMSLSLGHDALFRIGGTTRRGPTKSIRLRSGDLVVFGGPARLAFHGIDRVFPSTSMLVPRGGRLNLTLRRVTMPTIQKDARSGG